MPRKDNLAALTARVREETAARGERRAAAILIRWTTAELELVRARAAAAGTSIAEFVRRRALA